MNYSCYPTKRKSIGNTVLSMTPELIHSNNLTTNIKLDIDNPPIPPHRAKNPTKQDDIHYDRKSETFYNTLRLYTCHNNDFESELHVARIMLETSSPRRSPTQIHNLEQSKHANIKPQRARTRRSPTRSHPPN